MGLNDKCFFLDDPGMKIRKGVISKIIDVTGYRDFLSSHKGEPQLVRTYEVCWSHSEFFKVPAEHVFKTLDELQAYLGEREIKKYDLLEN